MTKDQFDLDIRIQDEEDSSQQYVWDLFVRVFHWSLVVAFSVAFYYRESEWDRLIHVYAGYTVAALLLSRIVWGFMKTGYASFRAFPLNPLHAVRYVWRLFQGRSRRFIGHNPAGSVVIYSMLFFGLTTIVSGFLVYNDGWLIDDPGYFKDLHYYVSWGWLFLVVIHILGVVTESIVHQDNLIKAMITGCKRRSKKTEKSFSQKTPAA